MGFDNECIQNIQALAGEYFCPVCRLLVYPDEALYTQCTHLYCKPCLAYVVSTTRICPYDGYPVVEADTKPVTEANKPLAETIGRIAVNCLYHRSGCTWQGALSETTAHCAGCAFGNSPVVCNRCGTQIVHRQVQEHAQICPGEQPLAQQAENPTGAAEQNQSAAQAGAPALQSHPPENAAGPATGQVQNQGTPNAQPQVMPQVAPIPEQWYQQQQQYYQQYYQQYPGYDPYQQQYQQYIQYQQQLQAHPQQVIQGQPQPQPFIQPQSQPQPQAQMQPQPQGSLQGQAPALAQTQSHPQSQLQAQPQAQPHPHLQPQVAVQPQIQAQVLQQQPHAQAQVLQQQPHAPVQSHPQMQPQTPLAQQQVGHHPHPQGQPQLQLHPQQHSQIAQHSQPRPQVQLTQPHPRPQQIQPQLQAYPQSHIQHHPQMQPQPQPHPQSQPQPQHPSAHAVTGHQSYPQQQPYPQMPPGAPQHSAHIHPQQQGASHQMMQHPVQVQSQLPPQQSSQLRPPHTHPPPHSHVPQQLPQQPVTMSTQGQHPHVPPVQQQQIGHHPGQQIHHQPAMQLPQQQPLPHQQPHFTQQQGPVLQPQPFPGQAPGTVHNQQHQQSPFAQPQPIQPQQSLRPKGPPFQQQSHSQALLQQNIPLATHHSQNPAGRPMVPNQTGMHQPLNQISVVLSGSVPGQDIHGVTKVLQPGAGQPSSNQGILSWTNNRPQLASDQQSVPLQQSVLPRSDIQSTLLPDSPQSGKNAQVSASQSTSKLILSQKNQGDFVSGKAGELHKLDADGSNVNASGTCNEAAPSVELKTLKSENDLKSSEGDEKIVGRSDDKGVLPDHAVSEIDSLMKHGKDFESSKKDGDLEEPIIKQMVKEETSEKLVLKEAENEKKDEASQHAIEEVQDGPAHRSFSSLSAENLEAKGVKLRDQVESQMPRPWSDASGSLHSHPGTDKGSQGQALGPVRERNIHAPPYPPNVGPGFDRAVPHPGFNDRNLTQLPHQGSVSDEHQGLLSPSQMPTNNFVHPSHLSSVSDQERFRQLPMPYGPSPHMQDWVPQRPPAPDAMLLPGAPQMQMHGPPMLHTRPQGHNALTSFPQHQQGRPSIAPEHFQTPMAKQPYGAFPSEVPPGGFPSRSMPASFGMEPSLLGPSQSFELQSAGPHGHWQGQRTSQGEPMSGVPSGPFDSTERIMPGASLDLEGQMSRLRPANPIEAEIFANKRPYFFEGKGAVGGMHDTAIVHGLPEERFKPFPEERYEPGSEEGFKALADERFKPFPLDSGRRVIDRREFEEDLKQFPRPANLDVENMSRPLDWGPHSFGDRPSHMPSHDAGLKSDGSAGVPSGSAFPIGRGGSLHLMDTKDRVRPGSLPDNFGRNTDHSGPPDFLRHVSEFGRHPARSPGREHPGLPPSRFGNSSVGLGLGSQPRLEDFDGRDPHGFGERWSGALPAHLRRGELAGPGSLRINEQLGSGRPVHLRGGDVVGPDMLPIHLRGGEHLGPGGLLNHVRSGEPRNLHAHLRMGDPTGFGGIPKPFRMGAPGQLPKHLQMGGPAHLPKHLRIGESIGGGSFPSHLQIGEPGFGGGFTTQGFQGPQGDMEFDHSRKRIPGSNGWCRICKIDCESVEGLELHSQTREHQKMAMEMVLSIKKDNAKKHTLSSEERVSREDPNTKRKTSFESRGNRN